MKLTECVIFPKSHLGSVYYCSVQNRDKFNAVIKVTFTISLFVPVRFSVRLQLVNHLGGVMVSESYFSPKGQLFL